VTPAEKYVCNYCGREVVFDSTLPAYHSGISGRCDDPDCTFTGRYVHIAGLECGHFMWAVITR
jgi:hypothetical protein